jgi:hypothetical protein
MKTILFHELWLLDDHWARAMQRVGPLSGLWCHLSGKTLMQPTMQPTISGKRPCLRLLPETWSSTMTIKLGALES